MNRLIKFELTRLKNNKTLFLMPLLIIIVCVCGYLMITNNILGELDKSHTQILLLNIYNFVSQFLYIVLMYVFVSTFASDFSKGIYASMKAMGYSLSSCLVAKTINLIVISCVFVDICIVFINFILTNQDIELLMMVLLSLNINILYIIVLCLLLSIIIKKTLPAVLACLGMYIILDVLNQFVGLLFQIGDNSFTNYTLYRFIGITKASKVNYDGLDFEKYHWLFISIPSIFWILLMLLIIALIVNKIKKKSIL